MACEQNVYVMMELVTEYKSMVSHVPSLETTADSNEDTTWREKNCPKIFVFKVFPNPQVLYTEL